MKLPDEIHLDENSGTMFFDGEPLPWYIGEEMTLKPATSSALAEITVSFPAKALRITPKHRGPQVDHCTRNGPHYGPCIPPTE
jgi:hypothetical protein